MIWREDVSRLSLLIRELENTKTEPIDDVEQSRFIAAIIRRRSSLLKLFA